MEPTVEEQGISRRDALKKAAVAGAAVAWAAPAVQMLGSGAAGAQTFGSTCAGCVVSFNFNTIGSDRVDGIPLNIGTVFTFDCPGGTPVDVTYEWTTSNAVNCSGFPASGGTGEGIGGQYGPVTDTGNTSARIDFTCAATFTCRCFQQQTSTYTCTATGSASWPAPPQGPGAYGSASGTHSCAPCV